jgi:predicted outer membrane protein
MFYVMELVGKAKTGASLEITKTESQTLKADLDKVWADVASLASNRSEKIPGELTGGDKGKAERLGKAKDKAFDREFYKLVNREVEKLLKSFESSAKSGQDPEVKKIAGNWAPTIKGHVDKLDAAEKEAAKAK